MRYGVTLLGNNWSALALVKSLLADNLPPDLVVTLAPEARAKVSIAGASNELAEWVRQQGIPVYECASYRLNSECDRAFFADNSFGLGVCTDWQRLLPEPVLSAFADGVFGFHGSAMEFPNGRGRSPFNWSLRLGASTIYNNCFRYTSGADDGPVFNTTIIPVSPHDTIRTVQFKALIDYQVTIRRLLEAHRTGEIELTPQPVGASVWFPKLTPADSELRFGSMGLAAILNVVRASSKPFAGAFALTEAGERVTIWEAAAYEGPVDPRWSSAPLGTVLAADLGSALVKCRDGLLFATELATETEVSAGVRLL